ncbi:zinc finger protein [Fusarium redolens]|uniref:Zinc finger protein n=1 Tax=Fusarium redolens TaxID=48865 RepID=A0A9P9FUT7_FUSRE|nr:zinc finger protein [Fusarium redolens]KAH7207884.1 zinc finger protein [Fusarium redolens]
MSTCGTCWRQFPAGWRSRQQHMNATGHEPPDFECDTCDRYFGSQEAVEQHMCDLGHWDESSESEELQESDESEGTVLECDHCGDAFDDEDDLHDHEARQHFYCVVCDRPFQDWNSISQHLRGKLHRTSTVQCPFCKNLHGTATGFVHRLEKGCCTKAPLSRDKLYEVIHQHDPDGIISKKLLTWSSNITYAATEKAWNDEVDAYECYLCHRLFGKLASLNQHLGSPAHQQKIYHCPSTSCRKSFTTLAAMIAHLESESCGYMRFEAVQKRVQYIVDPRRMIQA